VDNSAEIAVTKSMSRELAEAIDQQRRAIFDAQAIVQVTVLALREQFGDWPEGTPCFDRPLRAVGQMLDNIAGALEVEPLEDRAREILRDWEAKP
jgi:hypothetical protein